MSHIHKQGGKYSHAYIQALLARVRIEEVIGDFVQLRRVNDNYSYGLCPFHNERTPSFTVRCESSGGFAFYHCFGCGAHGDAVFFLVNYHSHYCRLKRFNSKVSKIEIFSDRAAVGRARLRLTSVRNRLDRKYYLVLNRQREFGYLDAIRYLAKKYRYWPSQHRRLQKRLEKI